jgi:hypothetical protein
MDAELDHELKDLGDGVLMREDSPGNLEIGEPRVLTVFFGLYEVRTNPPTLVSNLM